jgi:RNA polymerase sigma-70 factor (ECF subfamily)
LRQAIAVRIRDEFRDLPVGGATNPLGETSPDPAASLLDDAIGREAVERYEQALTRLAPDEREMVIARVELGYTYQELASALGHEAIDTARSAVSRALLHLAQEMGHGG